MEKLNPTGIDEYLDEISRQYNAPMDWVIDEIEKAFAYTIHHITGYSVEVWVVERDGKRHLDIWACRGAWHESNELMLFDPAKITKNTVKLIRSRIQRKMRNFSMTENYANLAARLRGQVCDGRISRPSMGDGTLSVDLYVDSPIGDFMPPDIVTATCPVEMQPKHERGRHIVGQTRKFYVSRIWLLKNMGDLSIDLEVSRTSTKLPELLLKRYCSKLKDRRRIIKCVQRRPGSRSTIVVSAPIPIWILSKVQKELQEYLDIRFTKFTVQETSERLACLG